jgi:hypothetical protein
MSQIDQDFGREAIKVNLTYLVADGALSPGTQGARDVCSSAHGETHDVVLRNGRPLADCSALDREGFRFVRHDTKVADFYDAREIKRVYYPEMEALVRRESGASRVVAFDHVLRTENEELREARKIQEVVRRVHNDFTDLSASQCVRALMGDEAEAVLRGRFAIVQVWRPIRHPVETWPLAICDARSPADGPIVEIQLDGGGTAQTYAINYDPDQRWYWFPRMRRDEALVFKVYESLRDGRARWSVHTAFKDPTSSPHARPRESIEIRCFAFF